MPIPVMIDQLEEVPEELRPHYLETDDGRFMLDADGVEDVSGLKSALEKERAARKALKAELDALSDADHEAEGADGASDISDGEDETSEMTDTPRAEPDDAPVPEITPIPESQSNANHEAAIALRRQLESRLIEAEATAAVVAAGGVPELLLPVLLPKLEVQEEAGRFQVRVKGVGGDAETPVSIVDLVNELRLSATYGRAFDGTGKSGSGAPADAASGGGLVSLSAGDPLMLGRHLNDIASGRVTVEG